MGNAVISIDLMVPIAVKPAGARRSARLQGHDRCAARIVEGLDGALVDADEMELVAIAQQLDSSRFQSPVGC
jgi:hypothetical protein